MKHGLYKILFSVIKIWAIIYKNTRHNEMYPNLHAEKKWSNFAQDIDQKPFSPNFNDLYLFKYRSSH